MHECGYGLPLLTTSTEGVAISRLAAGVPPVTGTFDISFEEQTAFNIPADATDTDVKTLLESSLTNQGQFEVSRTGTCAGYQWSVRWVERGGDLPLMDANGSKLTGNEVVVSVLGSVDGGVWLRPFRGDMLRLPELNPQVHILNL